MIGGVEWAYGDPDFERVSALCTALLRRLRRTG